MSRFHRIKTKKIPTLVLCPKRLKVIKCHQNDWTPAGIPPPGLDEIIKSQIGHFEGI